MWESGDFNFKLDDVETEGKTGLADLGWELSRGLSAEYLLMEGMRVQDESSLSSLEKTLLKRRLREMEARGAL